MISHEITVSGFGKVSDENNKLFETKSIMNKW